MASDYESAADHFARNHIPPRLTERQQIHAHLEENFADSTVGATLKSEIADRVANRRGDDDAGDGGIQGDAFFDPGEGVWRDADTGQFTSSPEDNS